MIPRFIHSGMTGAPAMSTAVSGGLGVLNAALVDGFNVTAPNSVSASGGVVTFTYLVAHGYSDRAWLRISGASAAALNADLPCTVTSALVFTVPVPGIPDGPVSGTIAVRVAPLGWLRPFTATDTAVYRAPGPLGTRMFLQVRDNNQGGQQITRFRGFESMSSATVGVDPFPNLTQSPDASGSPLGFTKEAGTAWAVVGDDQTFYLYHRQDVSTFGDIASMRPGDAYGCWLFGGADANSSLSQCTGSVADFNAFLARDGTGLVKSLIGSHMGFFPGQSGQNRPYPGANSGGLTLISPMLVLDGAVSGTSAVRGVLRGLMYVMEAIPVSSFQVIDSVPGITGRVVILRDRGNSVQPASVALPIDQEW
jgi:hypothetical protein